MQDSITISVTRECDGAVLEDAKVVLRQHPAVARKTLIEHDLRFGADVSEDCLGDDDSKRPKQPKQRMLVVQTQVGRVIETRTYCGTPHAMQPLLTTIEQFNDAMYSHHVGDLDLVAEAAMCTDCRDPCLGEALHTIRQQPPRPFHGRA